MKNLDQRWSALKRGRSTVGFRNRCLAASTRRRLCCTRCHRNACHVGTAPFANTTSQTPPQRRNERTNATSSTSTHFIASDDAGGTAATSAASNDEGSATSRTSPFAEGGTGGDGGGGGVEAGGGGGDPQVAMDATEAGSTVATPLLGVQATWRGRGVRLGVVRHGHERRQPAWLRALAWQGPLVWLG